MSNEGGGISVNGRYLNICCVLAAFQDRCFSRRLVALVQRNMLWPMLCHGNGGNKWKEDGGPGFSAHA